MTEEEFLEEYFLICKRIYLEMERTGNWPWAEKNSGAVHTEVKTPDSDGIV